MGVGNLLLRRRDLLPRSPHGWRRSCLVVGGNGCSVGTAPAVDCRLEVLHN
ncbi:MAG: hypothetical protein MJE68_05855 [Proteobacteria bacterium]|nr:hypothetical protein [Pseudomonadota bacterium]